MQALQQAAFICGVAADAVVPVAAADDCAAAGQDCKAVAGLYFSRKGRSKHPAANFLLLTSRVHDGKNNNNNNNIYIDNHTNNSNSNAFQLMMS